MYDVDGNGSIDLQVSKHAHTSPWLLLLWALGSWQSSSLAQDRFLFFHNSCSSYFSYASLSFPSSLSTLWSLPASDSTASFLSATSSGRSDARSNMLPARCLSFIINFGLARLCICILYTYPLVPLYLDAFPSLKLLLFFTLHAFTPKCLLSYTAVIVIWIRCVPFPSISMDLTYLTNWIQFPFFLPTFKLVFFLSPHCAIQFPSVAAC